MTVGDFIVTFCRTVGLDISLETIVAETIRRAIELLKEDSDPKNNYMALALQNSRTPDDVTHLIESNEDYYTVFMSALMIVLEERTRHLDFTPEQNRIINDLLDKVQIFADQEV